MFDPTNTSSKSKFIVKRFIMFIILLVFYSEYIFLKIKMSGKFSVSNSGEPSHQNNIETHADDYNFAPRQKLQNRDRSEVSYHKKTSQGIRPN